MAIPITFKQRRIVGEIRNLDIQKENKTDWIVWWYCGIYKNPRAESQPKALIAFREILPDGLSDEIIMHRVPLTELGQMRVGTIWKNGMCHAEAVFDNEVFNVDFTQGHWKFRSFYDAGIHNESPPFPLLIHPLKNSIDQNWLIEFPLSTGGKLVVPCIEFFSRCYGRSQEINRVLATYPWHGAKDAEQSRLYAPLNEPEEAGKMKVKLRKRMVNGDVVFLAHAKYDLFAELAAKSIYAQIETQYVPESKKPAFLKAGPWFQGEALIKANGVWFDDGKSFLVLQIVGCSDPDGVSIFRDRENTNKTGTVKEGAELGTAWDGAPIRRLNKLPEIVDLTGDEEPDYGSATVEVKDPDFEVLGAARVIIDVRREHANSTKGHLGDGGNPNAFSSGEPYGNNKDVGHASIHARPVMESHGALRDIWNALLYLRREKPHLVSSVNWFTYEEGFQTDVEPNLIPLQPFKDDEDVEISTTTRNWLYYDTKNNIRRGALIARMIINGKPIYFFEFQRRPCKKTQINGTKEDSEQSFKGLVFMLDDQCDFEAWLSLLLNRVRYVRGIVVQLVGECPGSAATFKHTPAKDEQVPCEAAIKNALSKVGVTI